MAALLEQLATFRYSLFRLETRQVYSGSSEDEAFAAYQAGRPIPLTAELAEWCERVRRRIRTGCRVERVHVVAEPASEYISFELASYAPNVAAGENVGIIPVGGSRSWPVDVPDEDFWLVDSCELWAMEYDDASNLIGAKPLREPRRVLAACFARDAALTQSMPWSSYTSG